MYTMYMGQNDFQKKNIKIWRGHTFYFFINSEYFKMVRMCRNMNRDSKYLLINKKYHILPMDISSGLALLFSTINMFVYYFLIKNILLMKGVEYGEQI